MDDPKRFSPIVIRAMRCVEAVFETFACCIARLALRAIRKKLHSLASKYCEKFETSRSCLAQHPRHCKYIRCLSSSAGGT